MANSTVQLPPGHVADERFGRIYRFAPSFTDDLTQIDGIDSRVADCLNDNGIHCFAQLAQWSDSHIAEAAAALGVDAARISGEEWREQAHRLCRADCSGHLSSGDVVRFLTAGVVAIAAGLLAVLSVEMGGAPPFPGELAADTSAVVAAEDVVVLGTHVVAGDRVLRGQRLLTVDRQSLRRELAEEKEKVDRLAFELRQAEAQAQLDLEWRLRDVERDLRAIERAMLSTSPNARDRRLSADPSQRGDSSATLARAHLSGGNQDFLFTAGGEEQPDVPKAASSVAGTPQRGSIVYFSGASGRRSAIRPDATSAAEPVRTAEVPLPRAESVTPDAGRTGLSLEQLERQYESLARQKASLPEATRLASGVEQLKQQHSDALQRLAELESVADSMDLTAAEWGVVAAVPANEGDRARKGSTLLSLLHPERRYVVADVDSRRIHELSEGQQVALHFPGGEEYEGTVADIPVLAASGGRGSSTVRVRIEPAGRLWPEVPVGTTIDVVPLELETDDGRTSD